MSETLANRARRKWYDLQWGPEEAEKLMQLKGKMRGMRLAILQAHGRENADVLFERRQIQAAMRKQDREKWQRDPQLRRFAKSIQAHLKARRWDDVFLAWEISRAAEELQLTVERERVPKEMVAMRAVVVEAITEKNRLAVQLKWLAKQEKFLEALLTELPEDNIMRPDVELQLKICRDTLPDARHYYQAVCQEVERLKQEIRVKEEALRAERASAT